MIRSLLMFLSIIGLMGCNIKIKSPTPDEIKVKEEKEITENRTLYFKEIDCSYFKKFKIYRYGNSLIFCNHIDAQYSEGESCFIAPKDIFETQCLLREKPPTN